MTRYWVEDKDLHDFPEAKDSRVEVILASDLPAHDALLRAQVVEECAQIVEAVFKKAHTRASENADIYDAQDDAIERAAAALRQQGVS